MYVSFEEGKTDEIYIYNVAFTSDKVTCRQMTACLSVCPSVCPSDCKLFNRNIGPILISIAE